VMDSRSHCWCYSWYYSTANRCNCFASFNCSKTCTVCVWGMDCR